MNLLRLKSLFGLFCFCTSSAFSQNKIDYLESLKQGSSYDSQPQTFPDFSYQSPNAPELTALRKKYSLDSVAGSGSDIIRAKRLLRWYHGQVPHNDGPNISVLNANTIIDSYRDHKEPHGCYPVAIGMNEVFLACGFKSRVIICFSALYPQPDGGHVINSVFIPSLKKWIYMDPQDNAYVTDENGNLLSIAQVRERLIKDLPLKLNEDANYHDTPTRIKDYLYTFMVENLYRMITPLRSEYNSQTRVRNKTMTYVELLPVGSKAPFIDEFETQFNLVENYQVVTYHTNNSDMFWKQPAE